MTNETMQETMFAAATAGLSEILAEMGIFREGEGEDE